MRLLHCFTVVAFGVLALACSEPAKSDQSTENSTENSAGKSAAAAKSGAKKVAPPSPMDPSMSTPELTLTYFTMNG